MTTSLDDLKKGLRQVRRAAENELETHNANELKDKPVFDRSRFGRRERDKQDDRRED